MSRSKVRTALLALALGGAGLAAIATGPAASGEPEAAAPTIVAAHLDGSAGPREGFSGHGPTAEASPVSGPTGVIEGAPAEGAHPESVIGPDGRVRVTNTTSPAAYPIGQIEFTQEGDSFICTGWLIDSNSIISAGHCAYDPFISGPGADPIIETGTWYPGRNGATDPVAGGCPITSVWAPPTEWVINGQPYFDFSVMNFANPGPCADIDTVTGTYGLYANATLNALNNAQVTVQGYPGDKPFGTHWKMNGRVKKANKRFVFYPMDTFGGQSGSPVWHQRGPGAPGCQGRCGYAIHAYGTGLPGAGANNNGGPRITAFRIGQILDVADENGV
jgi:glutamyl endopeptidase